MEKNTTHSVLERVREIVAEEFGLEQSEFTNQTSFVSLGIDSLYVAGLLIEIEMEFGIDIERSAARSLLTVDDLVRYIT